MNSNIGLLYYKEYFKKLDFNNLGEPLWKEFDNQKLFSLRLNNDICPVQKENQIIELTTIYPGLLVGSGYIHEVGGFDNELKLGFFFDHTTGLPCIPGSSIKGVLRDAAEKATGHYLEYILAEIKDGKRKLKDNSTKELAETFLTENIDKLIGGKKSDFVKKVFDGEGLPIYQRDIFFDAFPIASGNENGKFLSNDYITHHEHPLKNPNPVQFLKVLPQVTFRFEFLLKDEIMPAALKLELFRQILLDLGIGAKTNVGYGQFTDEIGHGNSNTGSSKSEQSAKLNPQKSIDDIKDGDKLKAKITDLSAGVKFDLGISDIRFPTRITGVSPKIFEIGQIIEVQITKSKNMLVFNLIQN